MMKQVYVVTEGSYSDYHIVAIFTTKARAQEFMAQVASHAYNVIEIYDLDAMPIMGPLCRGLRLWAVLMLRDGTTESVKQVEADTFVLDYVGDIRIWRRSTAAMYRGKDVPDVLEGTVWARDAEHAVKIVNEKRTQMIAEGKWQ